MCVIKTSDIDKLGSASSEIRMLGELLSELQDDCNVQRETLVTVGCRLIEADDKIKDVIRSAVDTSSL